jgi:Fe-S-cluster-containing hydrogenase component 2
MKDKISNESEAGVITLEKLKEIPGCPKEIDFAKGPIAVIECDQDIPCNPCEDICENNAIKVGIPITNLPILDVKKCEGCIKCIRICPGLCIFVIHRDYTDKTSLIYIPYELSPLPEKGIKVDILNRKGEKICKGIIKKVIKATNYNSTAIVAMEIPKKYYNDARHFEFEK